MKRGRKVGYRKPYKNPVRIYTDEQKEQIRYNANRTYHENKHGGSITDDLFICNCGKTFNKKKFEKAGYQGGDNSSGEDYYS